MPKLNLFALTVRGRQLAWVLTTIALILLGTAQAQPPSEPVTLRAVGPHLNAGLIQFIANNAEPFRLDSADFADVELSTPRHIITKICGSVRDAYYAEFLAANQPEKLPIDQPLGDRAKELIWPACLYAEPFSPGLQAKVKPGETASDICVRMTGGGCSPKKLEHFFRASNLSATAINNLRPDQILLGAHATAPVTLFPKNLSKQEFLVGVQDNAGKDGPPEAMVRQVEPATGEIVTGVQSSSVSNASDNFCNNPSDPPFDAGAVARAYRFAMERRSSLLINIQGGQADIAIVDNGFFGADPMSQPTDPFKDSPFPRRFFKRDANSVVAQRLQIIEDVWPINFSNGITPDIVSGHGTHVAGLVLGGPEFISYREGLNNSQDSWALITIINIGKGSQTLLKGAQTQLQSILNADSGRRIVNLSVAYNALQSPAIKEAFDRLFRSGSQSLFIVSAGNFGREVINESIFPAALGGTGYDNVISVAALDGNGRLAANTNYSAEAVDLAAPGCELASWISNSKQVTKLSGTSQAAPLVTFTAALLRSLATESQSRTLKSRIIASGDLLEVVDQEATAFHVRLNIPKALFWFDDYLRLGGSIKGEYLGNVTAITGLRCSNDRKASFRRTGDIWAFKRDSNHEGWVFAGKSRSKIQTPCKVVDNANAELTFVPTHRIGANGPEVWSNLDAELRVPLSDVEDVVFKTEFGSN